MFYLKVEEWVLKISLLILMKFLVLYLILGAGAKNENPLYGEPMHNTKVVFNEDVLVTGAAIHTYSAITWLKNHK